MTCRSYRFCPHNGLTCSFYQFCTTSGFEAFECPMALSSLQSCNRFPTAFGDADGANTPVSDVETECELEEDDDDSYDIVSCQGH